MGLTLRVMPVGETVAIIYLAPLLVMVLAGLVLAGLVLAGLVLGETVPIAGWIGAAVGFAGVLLIVRPGTGLDP